MQPERSWSEWVRECREIAGWSQYQLAELSGVNLFVVQGVEDGSIRDPDDITRSRLVAAFQAAQSLQAHIAQTSPGQNLQTTTMAREYRTESMYKQDAEFLAQQGWSILKVDAVEPRGCLASLFGGKQGYRVTYFRSASTST